MSGVGMKAGFPVVRGNHPAALLPRWLVCFFRPREGRCNYCRPICHELGGAAVLRPEIEKDRAFIRTASMFAPLRTVPRSPVELLLAK
jgi:hypothetical protein